MKTKFYFMLAMAITMAACTDEDNGGVNDAGSFELAKKEWFFPSANNFESRNVKYYEDGKIVADSTFSSNGALLNYSKHSYTSTSHSWQVFGPNNEGAETQSFTYDSTGRLTDYVFSDHMQYTYTGNTITAKKLNPGTQQFEAVAAYTTNTDGKIVSVNHLDTTISSTEYLEYENGRPVALTLQQNGGAMSHIADFTYYASVAQEPGATALNNEILLAGSFIFAPQSAYITINQVQLEQGTIFEAMSSFNDDGYIQQQKTVTNGQPSGETHYTYNP